MILRIRFCAHVANVCHLRPANITNVSPLNPLDANSPDNGSRQVAGVLARHWPSNLNTVLFWQAVVSLMDVATDRLW